MVNKLYAHFRSYWPKPRGAPCDTDGYQNQQDEDGPSAQASESASDQEDSPGDQQESSEPNDLELARALGVPNQCLDRMSPRKVPEATPAPSNESKPPTQEEKRNKRIEELKSFACLYRKNKFWFPVHLYH